MATMRAATLPEALEVARTPLEVTELLGRRWALPILRETLPGRAGFRELRRRLANLSTSVLSQRLAELTSAGLLERSDGGYVATAEADAALRGLLPFGDDRAALRFAAAWIEAWNARDLPAVLRPYRDDVTFRSPAARGFTRDEVIEGKPALEAYWDAALASVDALRFDLDRALWDGARRELVVIYRKQLDATAVRAVEFFRFDEQGRVFEGEAMFGVPLRSW